LEIEDLSPDHDIAEELNRTSSFDFIATSYNRDPIDDDFDESDTKPMIEISSSKYTELFSCLDSVTRALRSLNRLQSNDDKTPAWFLEIEKKISSTDTHLNIKIFLTMLSIKSRDIFEQHSEKWWPHVLNLLSESPKFSSSLSNLLIVRFLIIDNFSVSLPPFNYLGK
jgi:hypothetical protein